MKRISEFFENDEGQLSAMRLYSFVALILAVILSLKGFLVPSVNMEFIYIWVAAAFAPKLVQKIIEQMVNKKLGGGAQ